MVPPGSLGWDTDLADALEPIEQCPPYGGASVLSVYSATRQVASPRMPDLE
jgi:hypothetical protein